jgi:Family of unknown function (DUF6428)
MAWAQWHWASLAFLAFQRPNDRHLSGMTIADLVTFLSANPTTALRFLLPDGGLIPAHAHVTEVGHVTKRYIDCGGTKRADSHCLLQTWVADDVDHQLTTDKLAGILRKADADFDIAQLPIWIEYEDGLITQFIVIDCSVDEGACWLHTTMRHTDCLAKDQCLPNQGCC